MGGLAEGSAIVIAECDASLVGSGAGTQNIEDGASERQRLCRQKIASPMLQVLIVSVLSNSAMAVYMAQMKMTFTTCSCDRSDKNIHRVTSRFLHLLVVGRHAGRRHAEGSMRAI